MQFPLGRSALLLLLLGLPQACRAQDSPYQDLLKRLPDSTNVLIVADPPGLKTALGLDPDKPVGNGGLTNLPVAATNFVMGAQIDFSQRQHVWSIAMAQLAKKLSFDAVAKMENEAVDQVAGLSVVASPRNAYFVDLGSNPLGPTTMAIRTPASRKDLTRWLNFQKSNQLAAIPQYLLNAVSGKPSLITIALDMEDALDPKAIHRGMNFSQVLSSRKNVKYDEIGNVIAKAKGLTFVVQPGSPLSATLMVDFDTDTHPIRFFAKQLLVEILEKAGINLAEFDEWQPIIQDRAVGMQGNLSLNSLRKIGALIRTPAPAPEAANVESYQSMNPQERAVTASKRYFKNLTQALDDLKADKTRNLKGLAGWYDQAADQISKMPILDVDPMLVSFAAGISEHLRAMSASLQGISLQSGYLQKQKAIGQVYQAPQYGNWTSGYSSYYGYYGGYSGPGLATNVAMTRAGAAGGTTMVDNFQQIRAQQDALILQGEAGRIELWQRIDDETAEVRRRMTEKYMTQF